VKVLLSDLLFDKTTNPWTPRTTGGVALPHDVIVYDPSIYKSDGTINPSSDLAARQQNGIFLTKAIYDARGPKSWVHNVNYYDATGPADTAGYWVPKSTAAALTPTETNDFRSAATTFRIYLPPQGSAFATANDYYTQSVSVAVEGSAIEPAVSLVLSNRDEALEATIPGTSLIPYTRLRLNNSSSLTEIYNLIRFMTGFQVGPGGLNAVIDTAKYSNAATLLADVFNPAVNVRLQTAELWIRSAYFADYISPAPYEQNLSQIDSVQHANIIAGSGTFSRYGRDANVAPYLPQTPPRADSLSAALLASSAASSLPIPPVTGTNDAPGTVRNAPIAWYDPDFDASYLTGYAVVPAQGNIYASGRVFSPTVDEIWTYMKKLVSGRSADVSVTQGPTATTATKINGANTRITAEPALTLGTKIGDPLNSNGSSFINAPEGLMYSLNTSIQYMANKVYSDVTSFYPFATHSATAANIGTKARVVVSALQKTGDWAPRTEPLSLRELEGFVLNCQFNLETAVNFITSRFVQTGETTLADTTKVGTIYQLHKGYVFNADTHEGNTKWTVPAASPAAGVTSTAVNSTIETFDDGATYGSALLGASNYDRMVHQSAQDVYLSAEGQWRYLFDHVRVPVITETY
jgi:hypothetical protein